MFSCCFDSLCIAEQQAHTVGVLDEGGSLNPTHFVPPNSLQEAGHGNQEELHAGEGKERSCIKSQNSASLVAKTCKSCTSPASFLQSLPLLATSGSLITAAATSGGSASGAP